LAIKNFSIDKDGQLRDISISYEVIHPSAKKDIIILHGWGSNKELMKSSLQNIAKDFRHIYIDMPGFGKSPNDKYVLYTKAYVEIIDRFLEEIEALKDIIIGHSFGGKVATLLNPKKLILMSSSGIIVPKPLSVRLKINLFKSFKAIGFGELYSLFASKDVSKMSRNMYETFKNVVDEDFRDEFSSYTGKTLVLWGKDDSDTPLSSGIVISELIQNSSFKIVDGDHYFFMQNSDMVKQHIEEFLSD